jgi:hypothetical protein
MQDTGLIRQFRLCAGHTKEDRPQGRAQEHLLLSLYTLPPNACTLVRIFGC